jgi:hypothetical protein
MSETDPIFFRPAGDSFVQQGFTGAAFGRPPMISFNRGELDQILSIYGCRVAEGEWRDYAIDMLRDRAVFSIFRRTAEAPLYRIEKHPRLARRQGAFSVIAATGLILKRGHELCRVLRVFDRRRLELVKAHQ